MPNLSGTDARDIKSQGYAPIDFRWSIEKQKDHDSVGGIMVSIAAFQAVDPGSIPGRRNIFGSGLKGKGRRWR